MERNIRWNGSEVRADSEDGVLSIYRAIDDDPVAVIRLTIAAAEEVKQIVQEFLAAEDAD